MKRVPQRELLDDDLGTRDEIATSLGDLRRINQSFGGIATSRRLVEGGMHGSGLRQATLLEVAAGDGFAIDQATKSLKNGFRVEVTFLDRNSSHLPRENGNSITGDALQLPFGDDAFDFVSCGLFLHHLSPEEVVRFATEALRVARHALLVNDIVRSPIHLGLVYLGMPLFRSRLTQHDAPASVRQAYTLEELRELLWRASPKRLDLSSQFLYRVGGIAWK